MVTNPSMTCTIWTVLQALPVPQSLTSGSGTNPLLLARDRHHARDALHVYWGIGLLY
jgi:hypothetical protein